MLRNIFRLRNRGFGNAGLFGWILLYLFLFSFLPTKDLQAHSTLQGKRGAVNQQSISLTAPASPFNDKTFLLSMATGGKVGTLSFGDEDILIFNGATGEWSKYFDGSDLYLRLNDVDGFKFWQNGELLLSFSEDLAIRELGMVHDEDIVKFIPASLGEDTSGRYEWFLDGSDVGLTGLWDDVDLLAFTPDGRLVVSTRAIFLNGDLSAKDEDLIVLNNATFGEESAGTWAFYFDGSDVALSQGNDEDVKGLWVDPLNNDLYLSVSGAFSTPTLSGTSTDIFICDPTALGSRTDCTFRSFWHGADYGLVGEQIDDLIILDNHEAIPNASLITTGGSDTETDDSSDEGDPDEEGEIEVKQQIFLPMASK